MKMLIRLVLLFLLVLLATQSWAGLAVKGGLAGGAGRVSGVLDIRQINNKLGLAGEAGYAIGNNYSILTAGLTGIYALRDNLSALIMLSYSAYSDYVNLPLVGDLTQKTGVGAGIGLRMTLRENLYAQAGYDTRLGALAEAGYILRK